MKKSRSTFVKDMLIDEINTEVSIEIQDKIQLKEDGVDVEDIYEEDFKTLKSLLYNSTEYVIDKMTARDTHDVLDYIDLMIDQAITYVKYEVLQDHSTDIYKDYRRKEEAN